MKKAALIIFIVINSISGLFAQKEEVNKYLRLVAYGKIDEVRAIIPDLLAKYPNDAGIKLLHGTILDDAFLALEVYQGILKNHPESEWADHAYWRIVQFYAVLGDTAKAQSELANFRSRYPASPFITPASDVVRSSVNLAAKKLKNTTIATTQTNVKKEIPAQQNNALPIKTESAAVPNVINPEKLAASTDLSQNKLKKPIETQNNSENKSNNIEKLTLANKSEVLPVKTIPKSEDLKQIEKKSEPVTAVSDEEVFFGLQVGIYKDKNTAEAEKNKFLVRRLRTQVVEKEVNGVVMSAVVIGHYSSLESAEEGKKIVSIQCGCEPIIYRK